MSPAYTVILSFVQSLTPTWRKSQQVNFARLLAAFIERPSLVLSDLARALPPKEQHLHGRLKRIFRFLSNPRLDELALVGRWLKLVYHFGSDLPDDAYRLYLPILLDTTYFEPFAALIATVPCGSRGLPIALTTYDRTDLAPCLPPEESWPPASYRQTHTPAASTVTPFLSQNHIEHKLIDLVWRLLSPALHGVLVADRGFARAALFTRLKSQQRDFVVRIDADTHVWLTSEQPSQPVATAALNSGERRWLPNVYYGKQDRVPINLLIVWDAGQAEPWYLVTSLADAAVTETMYRWRMRTECTHRDEKSGVLLREGGDAHHIKNVLHLHRLLLILSAAQWLSALTGLQAWADLPILADAPQGLPVLAPALCLDAEAEPALPPPIIPHRGLRPKIPRWMERFTARGHLSYVRLGMEVIRDGDLLWIIQRLVGWLTRFLSPWLPFWRPWQRRYRLSQGWTIPT